MAIFERVTSMGRHGVVTEDGDAAESDCVSYGKELERFMQLAGGGHGLVVILYAPSEPICAFYMRKEGINGLTVARSDNPDLPYRCYFEYDKGRITLGNESKDIAEFLLAAAEEWGIWVVYETGVEETEFERLPFRSFCYQEYEME